MWTSRIDLMAGESHIKASSRRHRILKDGTEELGDFSDDDDAAESLARRIARLKREIEEAKEEHGKQKASGQTKQESASLDGEIESLSKALDNISRPDESSAPRSIPLTVSRAAGQEQQAPGETGASYIVTYAPSYEQTHALAKAADFDRRLVVLEKALGVGSAAMPEFDSNGLPRAIIPLLDTLHKQVTTLSDASTSIARQHQPKGAGINTGGREPRKVAPKCQGRSGGSGIDRRSASRRVGGF